MKAETRRAAKIGVLVPFTNTNLEADMMVMRCAGYNGALSATWRV